MNTFCIEYSTIIAFFPLSPTSRFHITILKTKLRGYNFNTRRDKLKYCRQNCDMYKAGCSNA